jgi:hypothetical protein
MGDVAADGDDQPLQPTLVAADGQGVEQRLGRVFMRAVAGIDHRGIDLLRQQRRRARLRVADHQKVALHGVEGGGGVEQRLPLVHRGGADGHVDHVGAQALARQLETGAGAGRILEEQVDQRATLEQVALGLPAAVEQGIGFGEVEQIRDVRRLEPLDGEQVLGRVRHGPDLRAAGRIRPAPRRCEAVGTQPDAPGVGSEKHARAWFSEEESLPQSAGGPASRTRPSPAYQVVCDAGEKEDLPRRWPSAHGTAAPRWGHDPPFELLYASRGRLTAPDCTLHAAAVSGSRRRTTSHRCRDDLVGCAILRKPRDAGQRFGRSHDCVWCGRAPAELLVRRESEDGGRKPHAYKCREHNTLRVASGSPSRTRTYDLGINSPALYQLSYRGTEPGAAYSPARQQCKPFMRGGGPERNRTAVEVLQTLA